MKLIKVSAHDCAICAQLSYHDVSIAEDAQMEFEVVELGDLAAAKDTPLYNYIVGYHLQGDDSVIVPIYVIVEGDDLQASGEVKSHEELTNLITAWKTWKETQPPT